MHNSLSIPRSFFPTQARQFFAVQYKKLVKALATLLLLLATHTVQAGISYQLSATEASAGDQLVLTAVVFNDSDSAMNWTPPQALALQWSSDHGQTINSVARLAETPTAIELPVNSFMTLAWQLTVPETASGIQAVSIAQEPMMLAITVHKPVAVDRATAPRRSHTVPGHSFTVGNTAPGPADSSSSRPEESISPGNKQNSLASNSAFERFRNAISTYEPIYFDIGSRDGADARFQISFKYRLHTPENELEAGFFDHWYLGYTQTSLWDLSGHSKPFIDTTYNPSLFWRKDKIWEPVAGSRHFLGLSSGIEHMSNGKGGRDSRSLNSFFIQPQFNYRLNNGSTLRFMPRVKNYFAKADNPNYAHYMGYVDWKLRWENDDGLILDALYNRGRHGHYRTTLQAAWPLRRTFLNMNGYLHVQYFKGYGETLLGYRKKSPGTLRIGLSLVP